MEKPVSKIKKDLLSEIMKVDGKSSRQAVITHVGEVPSKTRRIIAKRTKNQRILGLRLFSPKHLTFTV